MARRKFFRRASRGVSRGFKRASSSTAGLKPVDVIIAGALYGAARPLLANMLPNLFSFGPVDSDNAIIGAAGWYGMKQKGIWKALGTIALGTEAGIVTARLVTGTSSDKAAETSTYDY